ncbi:uncharacterized protein [Ptychodera flava]|uniref:uncharacterized protein n=1 Tax=Ptychodera flava TaxID=63121 RepID=UPI003969DDCC
MSHVYRQLALCSLLCCLCHAFQRTELNDVETAALREFISYTMACKNVTGLTISMVRNGETIFAEGFGHARKDDDAPVTNETLFNIGSITKTFTSAVAAHAVGHSRALWSTPLVSILGDEFWLQGQFRTEEISLRDILANKAGIPRYWGVSTAALNLTRSELVRRMRYFEAAHSFRSSWLYSNYMYVLAGYVTEVLTEQTWEEAVRNIIFDKLGMNLSRVSADMTDDDWDNTCWSRIESEGEWIEVDEPAQVSIMNGIAPSSGIYSNAVDMAEYAKFHLNRGKNQAGEQVVDEVALGDTYVAAFAIPDTCCMYKPNYPVDDTRASYGMGWFRGSYRGYEKIHRTGSFSGYYCRLSLFHGENSGVFVCVNSPGDDRGYDAVYTISLYAYDLLLGLQQWLDRDKGCTYPNPWREPPRIYQPQKPMTYSPYLPIRPLTDYVGEYGHFAFGNFSVTYDEDKRELRYKFGTLLRGSLSPHQTKATIMYMRIEGPVSYREYFYSKYYPHGWPIEFDMDESGNIFDVTVPYFDSSYTPVFTKNLKLADAPEASFLISVAPPTRFLVGQTDLVRAMAYITMELVLTLRYFEVEGLTTQ